MAFSFRDRTQEFHSMCERMRQRSHAPSSILERRALLSSPEIPSSPQAKQRQARSEFSMMAAEISRNITSTAGKLEKLTKCKKIKREKERETLLTFLYNN
jgi:syntaxin 5